ncbi:Xylt1 [Symbiodinium necroappetens]|uniref:protein xylosyltransferase n=1 Tax=Symbiodinium necroappetens TaxID=1628268 RepID=A0A812XVJ1_9DINO|nr:Xylt1 [Symbiodinium necroappetens]
MVTPPSVQWLLWATLASGEEAYLRDCHRLMESQLRESHIQPACHQKVAGIYCSRLLEVERPRPLAGSCPLDPLRMASPNQAVEGDVPPTAGMQQRNLQEVAFGVLVLAAYEAQLGLVQRLLTSLWRRTHTFLVHVDLKSEQLERKLRDWSASDPKLANVHVERAVGVRRSGASLLAAELYGLRRLLSLSTTWHYFMTLSDSDQMVRPADYLQRVLGLHWGRSFINTEVLDVKPKSVAVECSERVHAIRMGGHQDGIPIRPNLTLASGSQFVVLYRDFAEFALDGLGETGEEVLKLVADGPDYIGRIKQSSRSLAREVLNEVLFFSSPDETFFHTLAVNSVYCTSHLRYNFHFHDTQGNFLDESSRSYTDFPTGSPPVLTSSSLPLLQQVREQHPIIFARKFDAANASSMSFLEAHVDQLLKPSTTTWQPASGIYAHAFGSLLGACGEVEGVRYLSEGGSIGMPQRLSLRAVVSRSCVQRASAALRGQVPVHGDVLLSERFVQPVVGDVTNSATALSPLHWIRVGTGWDPALLRFTGVAGLMPLSQASSMGLFAVSYWERCAVQRRLRLRCRSPAGSSTDTEEVLRPWQPISVTRLPLPAGAMAGWWCRPRRRWTSSNFLQPHWRKYPLLRATTAFTSWHSLASISSAKTPSMLRSLRSCSVLTCLCSRDLWPATRDFLESRARKLIKERRTLCNSEMPHGDNLEIRLALLESVAGA